jgi:hypothetical protein
VFFLSGLLRVGGVGSVVEDSVGVVAMLLMSFGRMVVAMVGGGWVGIRY